MHLGFTSDACFEQANFLVCISEVFFRLCNVIKHRWAALRPFTAIFSSFVLPVLGHDGYNRF
jgi:hypothetical protein